MDNLIIYVRESYNELINKVTWPTWKELLESTRLVVIATLIFVLIVFVMDIVSKQITGILYQL